MARRICPASGLKAHLGTSRDAKRSNWYSPGHSVGFSRAPPGQNLAGSGRSVGVNLNPLLGATLAIVCLAEARISPERDSVRMRPMGTRSPRSPSGELCLDKTCTSTCSAQMGSPFGEPIHSRPTAPCKLNSPPGPVGLSHWPGEGGLFVAGEGMGRWPNLLG